MENAIKQAKNDVRRIATADGALYKGSGGTPNVG